ncbi:hypothetical protein, partial [Arthrobacter sp.]|uniref:hypothetical protein n=1 Tax=Arthrobacter sp. TaxID=1667 RepID=UPI002588575A
AGPAPSRITCTINPELEHSSYIVLAAATTSAGWSPMPKSTAQLRRAGPAPSRITCTINPELEHSRYIVLAAARTPAGPAFPRRLSGRRPWRTVGLLDVAY